MTGIKEAAKKAEACKGYLDVTFPKKGKYIFHTREFPRDDAAVFAFVNKTLHEDIVNDTVVQLSANGGKMEVVVGVTSGGCQLDEHLWGRTALEDHVIDMIKDNDREPEVQRELAAVFRKWADWADEVATANEAGTGVWGIGA